jgi:WS/DGAT/MGAT family acyltransferase
MGTVTTMKLISPTDSLFLIGESREHPMHVAGLQLFEPPADSGPEFIRELHAAIVDNDDFQPAFRKHPSRLFGGIANLAWAFDDDIDIDYHLRRSALPQPGRVRELLELTSRLHGTLLDRHRPLWEAHLVEGLEDGRFAIYTKIHHSLLDGISAQRLMIRSMTTDADDRTLRVPWTLGPKRKGKDETSVAHAHRCGGIGCRTGPFEHCHRPRSTTRTTVDVALPCAEDDVQRTDRRCAPCGGPIVATGTIPGGQVGRGRDDQRCGTGDVRGRAPRLPHRG